MNENLGSNDLGLSEAGELRRIEILAKANEEIEARKRRRDQSRVVFASLCGFIAGGLAWTIVTNYVPNWKDDLSNSKSLATGDSSNRLGSKSVYEPMVENNRSGLVEKYVVQKVELQSAKIDFEAIDNTQLDELLVEARDDYVVGRIDGEVRVFSVTDL